MDFLIEYSFVVFDLLKRSSILFSEKKEFIKDLTTLISYKSVLDKEEKKAPFGAESKNALCFFLSLAEKFGFETFNYDNYIGEIRFGSGEELGIIGHLDVVPAGDGWETDPFTLTEKEGYYIGRGVLDDKGPMLICLYALKKLKDEKVKFNKKIRFFVGTNEEAGWKDVEYYRNSGRTFPKWGFSPDGDFPVVYAEKGPCFIDFEIDYNGSFSDIHGGTVINAVCNRAYAKGVIDEKLLQKYNLKTENSVIVSIGKAAHGSAPHLGKNAILPLLKYIAEFDEEVKPFITYLFDDVLGISAIGNETGKATISPNVIKLKDRKLVLSCDFRVPAKMNMKDFLPLFDKTGLKYKFTKARDPHYVPKDSEIIVNLLKAYNLVTGEDADAISQAGATFSSVFSCGVAFGPELPNVPSTIHEPNERIPSNNFDILFDIYYNGIKNLVKDK